MAPTPLHLADVVETFGPALRAQAGPLPAHQHRALQAIRACRSPALGGRRWDCPRCGHRHYVYHSCRNRHCPRCQSGARQQWLRARLQELPAVPYYHVVFTLPAPLAAARRHDPAGLYRALFRAASDTLTAFFRRRGLQPGMIAILHTWGQNLHFHPHVHLLVTAGGLDRRRRWQPLGSRFLFRTQNLATVYRAKCLGALRRLKVPLPREGLPRSWHVHVQAPREDPRSLLLYLARYVTRVALDERRLLCLDRDARTVRFRYRDYRDHARLKTLTLDGVAFLRRFLDHVLPRGFVKIRYYGLFAHGIKKRALRRLRDALQAHAQRVSLTLWSLQALLATLASPPPVPRFPNCRSPMILSLILPQPSPEHPP